MNGHREDGTPAAQPTRACGCEADPGMHLIGPYPATSARSRMVPTGGGEKAPVVGWALDGDRWRRNIHHPRRAGLFPSAHPSHHAGRAKQTASPSIITYHHRESTGIIASVTAPGIAICGDGGGGGNDGCSIGACPFTATHFSAVLEARSGVALSSSPSESASVAVASVGSESSNSSSSSSSSSSSPSSSLDSTRSPSPPSICSGASGDVGVGNPNAAGGGGGGGGGINVTQDGCEARYRSELGRGISPRYPRRDLFSSFFSSR